jgi:hypothetical protein
MFAQKKRAPKWRHVTKIGNKHLIQKKYEYVTSQSMELKELNVLKGSLLSRSKNSTTYTRVLIKLGHQRTACL